MDYKSVDIITTKLYSRKNKSLTLYGWVVLVLIAFIIFNYMLRPKEASFTKDEEEEKEVNPKFHMLPDGSIMDEQVDPQDEELKQAAKKNIIPVFNPNKHIKDHKSNIDPDFGRPNPKDFPVPVLLEPRLQCADGQLLLLLVIESLPWDHNVRDAIRNTWGKYTEGKYASVKSQKWATLFVMGDSKDQFNADVKEESNLNGDILQGDFKDTPYEETRKFMLATKWIQEHFSDCRPKYILKSQDNIYHNIPAILGWLSVKYAKQSNIFAGKILKMDVPVRDRDNWKYVPESDYSKEFLPDMIEGPVYIFDNAAFLKMARVMTQVTPIAMEDGFVGLLAQKAGIKPRHNDHFQMIARPRNICHQLRMFFIYNIMPNEHNEIYRQLRSGRRSGNCPDVHVREEGIQRKVIL